MKVLKYKDSKGNYQTITPIVIDNSEALARVDTEENRAIEAEKDLESKIAAETERAESAERDLDNKVQPFWDLFDSGKEGQVLTNANNFAYWSDPQRNLDIDLEFGYRDGNIISARLTQNDSWFSILAEDNVLENYNIRIIDHITNNVYIPTKILKSVEKNGTYTYKIDFIKSDFDNGCMYTVVLDINSKNGVELAYSDYLSYSSDYIGANNKSVVTSSTIYEALQKKLDVPSNTGSNGQVLTKTSTGLEWSDAKGGDDIEWDDCKVILEWNQSSKTYIMKSFESTFDVEIPKHPRLFVWKSPVECVGTFTNFAWSDWSRMDESWYYYEVDVPLNDDIYRIRIEVNYGVNTDCRMSVVKHANSLFSTITSTQNITNNDKDKVTIFKVNLTSDYQLRINSSSFDDGEVHLICENTSSSDITVTIPNAIDSTPIKTNVDSFQIPAGGFGEINIIRGFDTFYIRAV